MSIPPNDKDGVFYQKVMSNQYSFTTDEHGDEIIRIKTEDDFPYRIRRDGEVWKLSKAFSARVYLKQKFSKVGDFVTREDALIRIIKRHNKSCEYMTHWVPL